MAPLHGTRHWSLSLGVSSPCLAGPSHSLASHRAHLEPGIKASFTTPVSDYPMVPRPWMEGQFPEAQDVTPRAEGLYHCTLPLSRPVPLLPRLHLDPFSWCWGVGTSAETTLLLISGAQVCTGGPQRALPTWAAMREQPQALPTCPYCPKGVLDGSGPAGQLPRRARGPGQPGAAECGPAYEGPRSPQHTHASQPASFLLSPQLMSRALRAEEETSVPLQLTHDTQASLVPDTHD